MSNKTHFKTVDIALISIFSALWIALNYYAAPLSFQLLHLPVGHGIIVFFTLLLATWATGKYGAASAVGIIGSINSRARWRTHFPSSASQPHHYSSTSY